MPSATSRFRALERLPVVKRPFEQIVVEHGPTVLRVCRAVVGPLDAEDAWSETFLSALRAYPALEPNADIRAWLVTIAHRRALDVWRAGSRRAVPVERLPEPAAPGTEHQQWDPEHWDGELWAALQALPAKQRQAVAYHHLAGFRHRQVATILGGSEAAARRAAADGIDRLRRTYRPSADAPDTPEESR